MDKQVIQLLERIANALEKIAPKESAPDLKYELEDFKDFNWTAIDATVTTSDQYGPAIVLWGGNRYIRRSPNNSWGAAILFTRCIGKEGDRNIYERLVTFKELPKSAKPISREAESYLTQ